MREKKAALVEKGRNLLRSASSASSTTPQTLLNDRQLRRAAHSAVSAALGACKQQTAADTIALLTRTAKEFRRLLPNASKQSKADKDRVAFEAAGRNTFALLNAMKGHNNSGRLTNTERSAKNVLGAAVVSNGTSLASLRAVSKNKWSFINKGSAKLREALKNRTAPKSGVDEAIAKPKQRKDRRNTSVINEWTHANLRVDSFARNVSVPKVDHATGEPTGETEEHPVRRRGTLENVFQDFMESPEYKRHLDKDGGTIGLSTFYKNLCPCIKVCSNLFSWHIHAELYASADFAHCFIYKSIRCPHMFLHICVLLHVSEIMQGGVC